MAPSLWAIAAHWLSPTRLTAARAAALTQRSNDRVASPQPRLLSTYHIWNDRVASPQQGEPEPPAEQSAPEPPFDYGAMLANFGGKEAVGVTGSTLPH